jgi:N-acetylglucosamine-6-phosphate deacetylase
MTSLLITNCMLHDDAGAGPLCSALIEDGRIVQIGLLGGPVWAEEVLDAQGCVLSPGLIDVHVQGAGGADVLDATPEALRTISRTCARFGVTSFLATTVYMAGQANRHLKIAAECTGSDLGGAHLLGVHLEGPFISMEKRGMIQPPCIAAPSMAILGDIQALSAGTLRMMTVAPDLPECLDIIRALQDQGVIASLGHSKATYDQALRGFEAGITHVTHLFNAMPSLHHRDPGPLAAIIERPDITCQVITDGVHLHPSVLRLAYHALGPERFVTITDGMQAMGLPDGMYLYNGIPYESKNGTARYKSVREKRVVGPSPSERPQGAEGEAGDAPECIVDASRQSRGALQPGEARASSHPCSVDGTLIGTALGLNGMLERLIRFAGCDRTTALRTATENPAQVLGLGHTKGGLVPGMDADLVLLRPDLSVFATIVAGRIVYRG